MNRLKLTLLFLLLSLIIPTTAQGATLFFDKTKVQIGEDDQLTVSVELNPQGASVIGVDLIITYDPNSIEVVDVRNGDLFPNQIAETINNSSGRVMYATANPFDTYTTSSGTVAEVVLKGKSISNSVVAFDYSAGDSTDSNVAVSGGTDVLSGITQLNVKVVKMGSGDFDSNESPKSTNVSPIVSLSPKANGKEVKRVEARSERTPTGQVSGITDTISEFADEGKKYVKEQILGQKDSNDEDETSVYRYVFVAIFLILLGVLAGFIIGKAYVRNKQQ